MKTVLTHSNGTIVGAQTWTDGVTYPTDSIIIDGYYQLNFNKVCTIDVNTKEITESDKIPTLAEAQAKKKQELKRRQTNELNAVIGETADFESASYTKQETEARAWNVDNNVSTPFIDGLLNGRNLGETKQELVDKVITRANAYVAFYTAQLGKFQRLIKEVDSATSVADVENITW